MRRNLEKKNKNISPSLKTFESVANNAESNQTQVLEKDKKSADVKPVTENKWLSDIDVYSEDVPNRC